MPNSSIQSILHLSIHLSYLEESFCLDTIYSAELPKSRLFLSDVDDRAQRKHSLKSFKIIMQKYAVFIFLFIFRQETKN